ncbi:hypothetical protein HTS61_09975 [Escherichia coli]|nr:hypothetical protein [Escherichia coli]
MACSTGMAKTQHLTLEQRMALLEERTGSGRNAGSKSREPRLNSCRHNKPLRSAKLRLPRAIRR